MLILGIETSCDECSASIVENKTHIISNEIATQIAQHTPYYGVVPELASRLHLELIQVIAEEAIKKAYITKEKLDAIAVTCTPGLLGSLLVGVNFAKSFAKFLNIPIIGINHIMAHLYASQMIKRLEYPYIGLLVSGGHSLIAKINSYKDIEVMGASVDDAIGEAFDKVAKFYNLGYPGGVNIDRLAQKGDDSAFAFPLPHLKKEYYRDYDMSFSGLKSAVINQKNKYLKKNAEDTNENLAASFQKAAVKIVMDRLKKAIKDTGIKRVGIGGGVAANSLIRKSIQALEKEGIEIAIPPMLLCTDNGAMVAGLGCEFFEHKEFSDITLSATSRVAQFKHFL